MIGSISYTVFSFRKLASQGIEAATSTTAAPAQNQPEGAQDLACQSGREGRCSDTQGAFSPGARFLSVIP